MMRQNQNMIFLYKRFFRKACFFMLAGAMMIGLASCDRNKTNSAREKSSAFEKTYERGPLTLRVRASQAEITTAENLTLKLEAVIGDDYEVEFPSPGDKLEEFKIADSDKLQPTLTADGKVLHTQIYTLEPFLAGEYKIPPMKVSFWKKADAKPEKHDAETEAITIRVTSLLPQNSGDVKIKDLYPPMGLPGWDRKWIWMTGSALAIVALASAGIFFYRRCRNGNTESPMFRLPADELAHRELDQLVQDRLIEKGEIKFFYFRISAILRHYIENRFSLRAPEQTTEEFLFDLRQSPVLTNLHKEILKDFLSQCDLVKFARFLPESNEAHKTVEICREFIDQTKKTEELKPTETVEVTKQ
jgi:hypothetical protein